VNSSDEPATPILDVRTYKLVPGGRDAFDRLFRAGALPMLGRYGIEVVGYGPTLEDDDLYCLLRVFSTAAQREERLDAFYGSEEWRQSYREAVMALVETYHVVVIELTPTIRLASAIPTDAAG
jgi:NIPSNAP